MAFERDHPVTEARLVAVPFDPDRILDSLDSMADTPRPTFDSLEAAILAFEPSDENAAGEIDAPWLALRDTVSALSDTLSGMDRRSTEFAQVYDRFRALYARYTVSTAERDRARRALDGDDVRLVRWAQAAADTLRAWERTAYAGYDDAVAASIIAAGRPAHETITDSHGEARLTLEPGRWWLVVRAPDPENPFLQYYWNVPVRASRWLSAIVPLTERNGTRRWRH